MFTVSKDGRLSAFAEYEIKKLERLLSDLKRIQAGEGPTAEELTRAPVIEEFQLVPREVPCLVGEVTGHPRLGDTRVQTSEVWAYAPSLSWARTFSRFYFLSSSSSSRGKVQ